MSWGTALYPGDVGVAPTPDVSTVSSHLNHTRYNAYCTDSTRFLSEFNNSQLICRNTHIPQPHSTDNVILIIMECNAYFAEENLYACNKLGHWFAKAAPRT